MYEPFFYYFNFSTGYGHWLFKNAYLEINNQPVSEETELKKFPVVKTGTITELNIRISDAGIKDYNYFSTGLTGIYYFKVNPKFECSWLDGYYHFLAYFNEFDGSYTIRMKKIKTIGEDESGIMEFPAAPEDYFAPEKYLHSQTPVLHGKRLPKRIKVEKSVEFETEDETFPEETYQQFISARNEYTITIFDCDVEEQEYYKSLDKKTVVFNNQSVIVDSSRNLRNSFLSKRNVTIRLIGRGVYADYSADQFPECLGIIKYENSYNTENVKMINYLQLHPDKNNIAQVLSEGNYHSLKLLCSNSSLVKISSQGLKIYGTENNSSFLSLSMNDEIEFELKNSLLLTFDLSYTTDIATLLQVQGVTVSLAIVNAEYFINISGTGISKSFKVNQGVIYIAVNCNETKLSFIISDGTSFFETTEYNKPSGTYFQKFLIPKTASSYIGFISLAVMENVTKEMLEILSTVCYS